MNSTSKSLVGILDTVHPAVVVKDRAHLCEVYDLEMSWRKRGLTPHLIIKFHPFNDVRARMEIVLAMYVNPTRDREADTCLINLYRINAIRRAMNLRPLNADDVDTMHSVDDWRDMNHTNLQLFTVTRTNGNGDPYSQAVTAMWRAGGQPYNLEITADEARKVKFQ